MLRELLERGEHPGCVVGASAGAINAAYFAGQPDGGGVAMLEALWCKIRRQDIMPLSMLGLLAMILRSRAHLVEANALRQLLETHLSYERIEQATLPLHIAATDMLTGDEIVLSTGPVVNAVLASAAIPGVFPPCVSTVWISSMAASPTTRLSRWRLRSVRRASSCYRPASRVRCMRRRVARSRRPCMR